MLARALRHFIGVDSFAWRSTRHALILLVMLQFQGHAAGRFTKSEITRTIELVRQAFPASETVRSSVLRLTSREHEEIAKECGARWPSDSLMVLLPANGDSILGYAILDDVRGKDQLITYVVAVTAELVVNSLEIVTYREPYGEEVKHETWQRQFYGKKAGDPMRVGREIRNISGATISVRAVTAGVTRALCTLRLLRERLPHTHSG
jgi:Na+-translocating ferredoxin:NAD+ oxidoreductase RnfG subunit